VQVESLPLDDAAECSSLPFMVTGSGTGAYFVVEIWEIRGPHGLPL
jgi:hypothetical protein